MHRHPAGHKHLHTDQAFHAAAIGSLRPRLSHLAKAHIQQPRKCCSGCVGLGPSQKSRWWRGLNHPLDYKTMLGQGVHVARHRPMDKPDEHIFFDLFHRRGLYQIRTQTPVLLWGVDRVIVNPAGIGRLQDRVIEKKAESTAEFKYSRHLGDGIVDIVNVLKH